MLECLKILNQDYDKALPPLNWSFLQEIFHRGPAERNECLLLMTKQSSTSGSAQRFMENYVISATEVIFFIGMENGVGKGWKFGN